MSSAELSEAINSMFEWYRKAEICYAYLSDVPCIHDDRKKKHSAFRNSKWFTRGWTLQELLAPRWVEFFDRNWVKIGTKASLERLIQSITNISHLSNFDEACVAQKMSWASKRQTSRLEDQAYCLMGLFEVNMPLLYGEGQKAFLRLQLEILSSTDDDSLFAWEDFHTASGGLLANSPTLFSYCGDIQRRPFDHERPPPTMTNQGLRIELLLTPRLIWSSHLASDGLLTGSQLPDAEKNFLAPLNCIRKSEAGTYETLVISLHNASNNQHRRVRLESVDQSHLETMKNHLIRKVVYVKQQQHLPMVQFDTDIFTRTILIKTGILKESGFQISERYLQSTKGAFWDTELDVGFVLKCFLIHESDLVTAAVLFTNGSSECLVVVLVISYLRGWVEFSVQKGYRSLAEYVQSLESFRSVQALDSSGVRTSRDYIGVRTSRAFANGTYVSVDMKKADGSLRQSYIVDINVDLEGKVLSSGRPQADTYQFV
ncbi:HET domain-containing protein [Rutstroemia sp. NJR-2017a BVV2]|nr:HET domain-containing protein [Rutstroemia sp. NJR-2017a BVV2]